MQVLEWGRGKTSYNALYANLISDITLSDLALNVPLHLTPNFKNKLVLLCVYFISICYQLDVMHGAGSEDFIELFTPGS